MNHIARVGYNYIAIIQVKMEFTDVSRIGSSDCEYVTLFCGQHEWIGMYSCHIVSAVYYLLVSCQ